MAIKTEPLVAKVSRVMGCRDRNPRPHWNNPPHLRPNQLAVQSRKSHSQSEQELIQYNSKGMQILETPHPQFNYAA
jgi:hypothetical protein|tara:strand:+ start:86 stop:313 length:228 start_codon:yes stop_codon:yes gene_type:complete